MNILSVTSIGPGVVLAIGFGLLAPSGASASPVSERAGTITEYLIPTANAAPVEITLGPDRALWFTEFGGDKIGRITTAGQFTEYSVPTAGAGVYGIAPGPDGSLWFAESKASNIGRITTSGQIAEYSDAGHRPRDITAGSDGALWFTEGAGGFADFGEVGRIDATRQITHYQIVANWTLALEGITSGPDGNLWFSVTREPHDSEFPLSAIGKVTTAGKLGRYLIPPPPSHAFPVGITTGPDRALWFAENHTNEIGRLTTTGSFSAYPIPTRNSAPNYIAQGPDGALWFTEGGGDKIGRITTSGRIVEYRIPSSNAGPFGIALGPDGAMWFTELYANRIGRIATRGR
jgi:virginiamycin B lyase